jgi:uncharacterized iron-regulated protein
LSSGLETKVVNAIKENAVIKAKAMEMMINKTKKAADKIIENSIGKKPK